MARVSKRVGRRGALEELVALVRVRNRTLGHGPVPEQPDLFGLEADVEAAAARCRALGVSDDQILPILHVQTAEMIII